MKERIKKYWFPGLSLGVNLLSALFWVALRVNYSGISKFLGADTNQSFLIMNLPVMACGLSWLGFLMAFLGVTQWDKRKWIAVTGAVIGLITAVGGAVVVYFGAWDYLDFIGYHFWRSLAVVLALGIFALALFCPMSNRGRLRLGIKWGVLLLAVVLAVALGYQLLPCRFTYGAVVYAVEDDYQIVFSTSDSAMAWVEIGGECYYDLYAGSSRSVDKVHKVTVPQTVLDAAGGYTVCAQQMIYRGPFGGYKGDTISQRYSFRGVDASDGLDYISISDVHGADAPALNAAKGEGMDFIVLLGDLVSMVETEEDCQFANKLAHDITGGQIPVIYARGNHEIKGEYAENFYKYVGSLHQGFAYTVTLGRQDVFAVVLDMGEDHEDDWWEYYGTARFDLYRQEQTQLLEQVLAEGDYLDYDYTMAICHIPIVYVDAQGYFEDFRREWTGLLNEMNVDISVSGHEHRLYMFLPETLVPDQTLVFSQEYPGKGGREEGGTVTDFHFPTFIVARRSLEQAGGTEKFTMTQYTCMYTHVDLAAGTQTSRYVNSDGKTLTMAYPFQSQLEMEMTFTEITTELAR